VKGNINIEEILKQKFDNFQPDVNPNIWANVQAGIGAGTAVTIGVSIGVKIGLISSGIIAASVATWYFGFYEPTVPAETITQKNTIEQPIEKTDNTAEPIIVVNDQNDPVIIENKEKIENELRVYQAPDQTIEGPINYTSVSTQTNNQVVNDNVTTTNTQTTTGGSNENNTSTEKQQPVPSGRIEIVQSNAYSPSATTFTSNALNQKEVRWDFGDGTAADGLVVKHTYNKPGKYLVKMVVVGNDKMNYEETQEVVVKSKSSIDNVPNVITPNGDRINDYFSVKTTDIETFVISIRDNRGNEIFNSTDTEFSWDGTDFSGNVVEKGMYTYLIIAEGKDGSVIKLPGQIYVQ
jgi:gliding motility-associated-like protein